MRCKHKNILIEEQGITWFVSVIMDGEKSYCFEERDYLTGVVQVYCKDCGFQKTYKKNKPKWLESYMQKITDHSMERG